MTNVMLQSDEERDAAARIEQLLEQHPQLKAARTPFQKRMAVRPILKKLRQDMDVQYKKQAHAEARLAFAETVLKASDQFPEWQKLPAKLEKNDHSRLHHLVTFLKLQAKMMPEIAKGDDPETVPWEEVVPFVVQHDWAGAFQNATDYAEGGFKLPYEMCAFEFRISGRSVTLLAFQADGEPPRFTHYVQFGDYWVSNDDERPVTAAMFAVEQAKAICVALEAEVATRHLERAPEKLNKKRVADGKMPLYSYHIINLNRRYRPADPSPGGGMVKAQKRLHFRRGHWRHYAEFKTWIRWTLVGNPELGFIDKEYRL